MLGTNEKELSLDDYYATAHFFGITTTTHYTIANTHSHSCTQLQVYLDPHPCELLPAHSFQ
jgi:hypothetical protein